MFREDWKNLQPSIARLAHADQTAALADLARGANQSKFHFHRRLRAALGETPKQFVLRLRLDRAAEALVSSKQTILEVALSAGFESHETFCRAFRKRFGMSPSGYRKQGRPQPHALRFAACFGLYHLDQRTPVMNYTITQEDRAAQPVLVIRRKVKRADIAATIGQELPKVFLHAQRRAIPVGGFPITRYPEISFGTITLETGMRVTPAPEKWDAGHGEGEVLAETLPAGPTAVTVHTGPYELLHQAYAALEEWMAANGFKPRGAPWEAYLNDPGDHPDPKDWKTEVCWPVERA